MQTKLYRRSTQLLQTLLLTSSILSGMVFAQSNYPNHTIQVTMPLQAGSAVDVLMRPFSQKMSEVLGQSMIIENITGGAGLIGAKLTKIVGGMDPAE